MFRSSNITCSLRGVKLSLSPQPSGFYLCLRSSIHLQCAALRYGTRQLTLAHELRYRLLRMCQTSAANGVSRLQKAKCRSPRLGGGQTFRSLITTCIQQRSNTLLGPNGDLLIAGQDKASWPSYGFRLPNAEKTQHIFPNHNNPTVKPQSIGQQA